jgi:hypothetical protein
MPLKVRTKSQNSSSTQSGIKDAKRNKEELEKAKQDEKRKRFDKKMQQVNDDFQKRCLRHLNDTVDECDYEEAYNPQYVAEFTKDIMKHFMATEMMNQPQHKYMDDQPQITERMRSILIDWIIEVHFQFKLKTESLFLTINMIDRYLEKVVVTKENL